MPKAGAAKSTLLKEMRAVSDRRYTCVLADFLALLSAEDRREAFQAFADKSLSTAAIWQVLRERGFVFTLHVLRRHREAGNPPCKACERVRQGEKA